MYGCGMGKSIELGMNRIRFYEEVWLQLLYSVVRRTRGILNIDSNRADHVNCTESTAEVRDEWWA